MILQKYRRKGIGYLAAKTAFGLYNANWKVAQMEKTILQHHFGEK